MGCGFSVIGLPRTSIVGNDGRPGYHPEGATFVDVTMRPEHESGFTLTGNGQSQSV